MGVRHALLGHIRGVELPGGSVEPLFRLRTLRNRGGCT